MHRHEQLINDFHQTLDEIDDRLEHAVPVQFSSRPWGVFDMTFWGFDTLMMKAAKMEDAHV